MPYVSYLCYEDRKYVRVADDEQTSTWRFEKHLRLEPNHFLEYSAIYWVQPVISVSLDAIETSHSYENGLHHFASSEMLLVEWLHIVFLEGSNRTGARDSSSVVLSDFFPATFTAKSNIASVIQHEGCAMSREHLAGLSLVVSFAFSG